MCTVTGLSHQPPATAAAATATADEPDAGVSPAPRSQTSARISCAALRMRELDVRALREPRMGLDRGAEPEQDLARRLLAAHDGMRVADRDRSSARRRSRARRSSPARRRRPARRPSRRRRRRSSGRATSREPTRTTTSGAAERGCEPAGGDACAVPRHLGRRAVRVPDHDLDASSPRSRSPRGRRRRRSRARRRRDAARGPASARRRRRARRRGSCYRARAISRSARPHLTVDDRSRRSYRGAGRRAPYPRAEVNQPRAARSRIAATTSTAGRFASTTTIPGIRRIHFRW